MWTGLGIIFIIIALSSPFVIWGLQLWFTALFGSEDKEYHDKEARQGEYEAKKYEDHLESKVMERWYRKSKLNEEPKSTRIRESRHKSVPNGCSWCDRTLSIDKNKFENAELYNKYFKDEGNPYVLGLLIRLVLQYINAIGYDGFYYGFITLLLQDHDLLVKFFRECHAAEEWKKDNNTVYDCENYMQDFMKENNVIERVREIVGDSLQVPSDFRHYRTEALADNIAKQIQTEKHIAELHRTAGSSGSSAEGDYKLASVLGFLGIASAVLWLFTSFNTMWGAIALTFTVLAFIVLICTSGNGNKSTEAYKELYDRFSPYSQPPENPIYAWSFEEEKRMVTYQNGKELLIKPSYIQK